MQKFFTYGAALTLLGVIGVFIYFWQTYPNTSIKTSSDESSSVNMSALTGDEYSASSEQYRVSTIAISDSEDSVNLMDNIGAPIDTDQVARLNATNSINSDGMTQEQNASEDLDLMVSRFNELLFVDSPNYSMENKISIEEDILNFVDQNPESITRLFDLYEQSHDPDYMTAVIDVISMIENPQIEKFAMKQIDNEFNDHTLSWLRVLRSTGINEPEDRARVLLKLDQFSDPVILSNALSTLKYRPFPVDESERDTIISQLQIYLSHENTMVSQAALDVINNWNHEVM